MKVVTSEQMREIDRKTIEEYGVPSLVLMERAGLSVVTKIKEIFGYKRIIVVSGSGSNGGDGLVIARLLHNKGWHVKAFLTSKPEKLKGDALFQYKVAQNFGVDIHQIDELLSHHTSLISGHSLIVDAILGTGLSKQVKGILAEIIQILNTSNTPIISVDIPSGISSDNGQIMGEAIKADYTVTFGLPKRGHLLYPGALHTGKLFIEDIGFPKKLLTSKQLLVECLEKKDVSLLIPKRQRYSHKGNYGHILLVSGSKGKTGAALMAAKGCLRSGAGLVSIGIPESLSPVFQSRVTEEMTLALPDRGNGTLSKKASHTILEFLDEKADVLAIGPGIGVSTDTEALLKILIKNSNKPLIIDADGLNSLKGELSIFSKAKVPIILTPHPGEMARLLKQSVSHQEINTIEKDRIKTSLSFSQKIKTYLVLKGVPTIIASPDGRAFISPTGNPGMATGGTGDVLTGMIAGFLGQGLSPFQASILGVYLHGLAGDIAASEKGLHSLTTGDILETIPSAFSCLKSDG